MQLIGIATRDDLSDEWRAAVHHLTSLAYTIWDPWVGVPSLVPTTWIAVIPPDVPPLRCQLWLRLLTSRTLLVTAHLAAGTTAAQSIAAPVLIVTPHTARQSLRALLHTLMLLHTDRAVVEELPRGAQPPQALVPDRLHRVPHDGALRGPLPAGSPAQLAHPTLR